MLGHHYNAYHTASEMPTVVLVATMSRFGHWLKSRMLENTHMVPSHVWPIRAEQARTKLPSERHSQSYHDNLLLGKYDDEVYSIHPGLRDSVFS